MSTYSTPYADKLEKIPVAHWFFSFPLVNYATPTPIRFADGHGRISSILLPSGQITRVPGHTLKWISTIDGTPCSDYEFDEPVDLPDSPNEVAVITETTYHNIHTWNANCGYFEKVDMSWMMVLGPRCVDNDGTPLVGVYRGLITTPEVRGNSVLMTKEFRQTLQRLHLDESLLPQI